MFEVKAGTVILVWAPHGRVNGPQTVNSGNHSLTDLAGWKPYTTKEDKLYDKHEVWDIVAVLNKREDVPEWASRNILEHGKAVLCVDGVYAMVRSTDITFLD